MSRLRPRTRNLLLGIFVGAWIAAYGAVAVMWFTAGAKPVHMHTATATCGIRG